VKTKPNEPINCNNGNGFWSDEFNRTHGWVGLTKREYFAAMALQGILSNASGVGKIDWWSGYAVKYADQLITDLNKETTAPQMRE